MILLLGKVGSRTFASLMMFKPIYGTGAPLPDTIFVIIIILW
jgi:hypothetical protein